MSDDRDREAEARWGATDAYRTSQKRWDSYSEDDKAAMHAESETIVADMAAVMAQGVSADDPAARAVAERHRQHIDRWFYPCDHWMHAQVAEMYVYDDRFKAFYEKHAAGLAEFFSAAVEANTLVQAGEVKTTSALEQLKAAAGLKAAPATADSAPADEDAAVEQTIEIARSGKAEG